MKPIILLGSGGHSKVIQDMIESQEEYRIIGHLDDKFKEVINDGLTYRGPLSYASELAIKEKKAFFVVCIGNNTIRNKVVQELKIEESRYSSIIHPSAIVSSSVNIGYGTVVMPGVVVNSEAEIADHVILNTGCIIEHDCQVERFAHISPKAALAGGVCIGEGAHIGIGAQVIQERVVGKWSTIGAGAAVISDIPPYCTAVGVPAKPVKYHQE